MITLNAIPANAAFIKQYQKMGVVRTLPFEIRLSLTCHMGTKPAFTLYLYRFYYLIVRLRVFHVYTVFTPQQSQWTLYKQGNVHRYVRYRRTLPAALLQRAAVGGTITYSPPPPLISKHIKSLVYLRSPVIALCVQMWKCLNYYVDLNKSLDNFREIYSHTDNTKCRAYCAYCTLDIPTNKKYILIQINRNTKSTEPKHIQVASAPIFPIYYDIGAFSSDDKSI